MRSSMRALTVAADPETRIALNALRPGMLRASTRIRKRNDLRSHDADTVMWLVRSSLGNDALTMPRTISN